MIERPVTGSLSLDNKHMDDSENWYINDICITLYYRTFGKEIVKFILHYFHLDR